ncbi:MAG: DUF1553 domain-containing protein [Planctomycetota bacterium]|nr:MAG: DUF1553 domain-containing protein [Planctomycetota bacterium]
MVRPVGKLGSAMRSVCLAMLGLTLAWPAAVADDSAAIWSLRPVQRLEVPAVSNTAWPQSSIDHFILAPLEAKGWRPASPVPKAKLIRRAYFDLWGLPPTPEEVRAFVADERPEAYEQLIDHLLASPHYGERWARHWLDLVRFAETNGYERDALKPNAWRYRDWVIDAFNDNMPYDRFVVHQLAGDQLSDADERSRIATGFLRVGTFDDEPNDPAKYKFEQLDDLMHATSTAFLAVTLKCARCHDHKFDPIPQTDYYAMLNFFAGGKPAEGELLVFTDASPRPPEVKLLAGGDPAHPKQTVPPGFLSMIPLVDGEAEANGRRLQLARWITDPENPLTARVMVNRIWQHHFGEGLVRTPDNFGVMGEEPTHPELLDWLASELVEGGWRLKRLHKMIMLSSAYQMDSTHPDEAEYSLVDFANNLWWRRNRQRLEAEPLRDAMLATSGQLNLKAGGPSFFPPATKEALEGLSKKKDAWGTSPPEEQRRRSVYMMTKRSLLLPLMTTFDFADTTQPCSQRNVSTVAPQALALLNNDFVHEQSTAFAERVAREVGDDPAAQVDRAWWLALSRPPTEDERDAALKHLETQSKNLAEQESAAEGTRPALASLCHVLLNLNEFIYVD